MSRRRLVIRQASVKKRNKEFVLWGFRVVRLRDQCRWFPPSTHGSLRGSPASEPDIQGEVQRLTQQLAGRVKVLEEHYIRPLLDVEQEVEEFGAKAKTHLKKMGVV